MSDYVIFIVLILNIILGVGVFLRNPSHLSNRYYAAFVAILSIWMIANYLENEPSVVGEQLLPFFVRLDFFSGILTFYFWFCFISVFVETKFMSALTVWRKWLFVVVLFFAFTPFIKNLLIFDITFSDSVIHFKDGQLLHYYAGVLGGLLVGGLILLLLGRRDANINKNFSIVHQIDLILLGSGLSLAIALPVNILQAYFDIPLDFSRIGLYGMILLVIFTGYAMVQAKFFEMRLLIVRSVASLIFTLLFSVAIVSFIFYLSVVMFGNEFDKRVLATAILVAVFATSSLEYLHKWFARMTNKIFFKERYDAEEILNKVTRAMIEESELSDMGVRLLETITQEFRLEKTAFLFMNEASDSGWIAKGFSHVIPPRLKAVFGEGLTLDHIVTDELPKETTRLLLEEEGVDAIFSIKDKEKLIALFFVGRKLSGDPLNQEDISFLKLLSSEIGIGIQNAQSYTALRRFRDELEERVRERTHELQDSQKKELEKAQEVARLKDEFVFLAAHELRTPVTAIRGFLELTLDDIGKFPKDIQENLLAIKEGSEHLNQMITDLLEIARSENSTTVLSTNPTAFEPILTQVLTSLAPLVAEKNIAMTVHVEKLPLVRCDISKTREVLINLIGNAIKYNRPNGIIDINVYRPKEQSFMIFEVRDSGYGVPKEQQEKLFQKFFRAVSKETENIIGTGLGLFITRMLVEKMGGKIAFSSRGEQGTTFTFTLPLA